MSASEDSTTVASTPFRLLDLCYELRIKIYEKVFEEPKDFLVDRLGHSFHVKEKTRCGWRIFTCRERSWIGDVGCGAHGNQRTELNTLCGVCGNELDHPSAHSVCWKCGPNQSGRALLYTNSQIHREALFYAYKQTTPFFETVTSFQRYIIATESFNHLSFVTRLGIALNHDTVLNHDIVTLAEGLLKISPKISTVFPNLKALSFAFGVHESRLILNGRYADTDGRAQCIDLAAHYLIAFTAGLDMAKLDLAISGLLFQETWQFMMKALKTGRVDRRYNPEQVLEAFKQSYLEDNPDRREPYEASLAASSTASLSRYEGLTNARRDTNDC